MEDLGNNRQIHAAAARSNVPQSILQDLSGSPGNHQDETKGYRVSLFLGCWLALKTGNLELPKKRPKGHYLEVPGTY